MACCRGEGEAVEGVCVGRLAEVERRDDGSMSGAAGRAVVPRGRMAVKVQETGHIVAARLVLRRMGTWRVK